MLVFVDESGDAGFKFGRGSSRHFVVVAVVFRDHDAAHACDRTIVRLRSSLGWSPRREFHFNKMDHACRTAFLEAVAAFEFSVFGLALDKQAVRSQGGPVYTTALTRLLESAAPVLTGATIVADAMGSRRFRQDCNTTVREWINAPDRPKTIRRVRFESSHSNNLLQLADMAAGALARCYRTDLPDCRAYWRLIAVKAVAVREWPGTGQKSVDPPPSPG